jgi:hypothetical protein
LERQWKDIGPSAGGDLEGRKDEFYQLRDKSASFGNDLSVSPPPRPTTCLGIENTCNRMKTGKKLRILESRNDTYIVEDHDELPSNSMENVKENTVYGKDTPGREDQQAVEIRKEIQNKRLSSQNEEDLHIQSQIEVTDNGILQRGSALCINNNADDYIPNKEENQGIGCIERCNDKTNDCCQDVQTGHGNKVIATHISDEHDAAESSVQEIFVDKSYSSSDHNDEIQSDIKDRSKYFVVQEKAVPDTGTDENILRVKGGGYTSPSDNLPEIFQTVEDVDKVHRHQSAIVSSDNTVPVHKERGRLDKSYSTPAYDLTDCDQRLDVSYKNYHMEEWTNWHVSENSSSLPSPTSETSAHSVFQIEKHSQAVPSKTASNTDSELSDVITHDSDLYSLEDKQTQRIGEILETINIALLQHRLKEHSNVNRLINLRNPVEQTDVSSHRIADSSYHENSTSKDEISDEASNQPCVPSNDCTSSLNTVHTVLLEDSDHKESEIVVENNLAGSFQEPETSSITQMSTTRDLTAAERGSEVWHKAPIPIENVIQPQNEEKHHTYSDESVVRHPQAGVSPVKICVTPPEPPPRHDHPKGGSSVGHRAIMAARSLGRNASSKNSVVGGGHASVPSPRSLRKRNMLLTSKFTLGT